MVKTTLIVFFILLTNAFASNDIQVDLKADQAFYNIILDEFWSKVPYTVAIPEMPIVPEGHFKAWVSYGEVNFGPQGSKLFTIIPMGDNKLQIQWHLENLSARLRIKAQFKKNVLGVMVTVNEKFNVKAHQISNAASTFQINFVDGKFDLILLSNTGFRLQHVEVKSTDDIFTTWLLDELNVFVKAYLNSEIAKYVNGKDVMKLVKEFSDNELKEFESTDLQIGLVSSKLTVKANKFKFNEENLEVGAAIKFDSSEAKIHPCAGALVRKNKSRVIFPHKLIEELVLDLATFEKDQDEDGLVDEPLFCYGYKDGKAEGEMTDVDIEVMGKTVRTSFKYWAIPTTKPEFTYDLKERSEDHIIGIKMGAKVRLEGLDDYPKIILKENELKADLVGKFKLVLVAGKGIILDTQSLKIENFDGEVYVKVNKYLPKIKVPFSWIKSTLEKSLLESLNDSMYASPLIQENIPLSNMNLKLNKYEIMKDNHKIEFEIQ